MQSYSEWHEESIKITGRLKVTDGELNSIKKDRMMSRVEDILQKMPKPTVEAPAQPKARKYRPISPIAESVPTWSLACGDSVPMLDSIEHLEIKESEVAEMESPEKLKPIDLSKLDQKLRNTKSKK